MVTKNASLYVYVLSSIYNIVSVCKIPEMKVLYMRIFLKEVIFSTGKFDEISMMKVLRDDSSCICRPYYPDEKRPLLGNPTTGSMVSTKAHLR